MQCRGGNESVAGFGLPRFHECFTAKFYDVRRQTFFVYIFKFCSIKVKTPVNYKYISFFV